MKRVTAMAAAIGVALAIGACSDPVPPTAPTPLPATITETFTGTLPVAGNNFIPFTVKNVGAIKVSLIGLDPGVPVGIGVGTQSTGVCTAIQAKNGVSAGPDIVLDGTATVTGNSFCVSIYDLGGLTEPENYAIVVQHS
jgi:hypothetical protein